MSRPMEIDFAVAVPNEPAGHSVASKARAAGYACEVSLDDGSREWTCYCSKRMYATYDGVISCQKELDVLAKPFGGYTEGWGTFGNVD